MTKLTDNQKKKIDSELGFECDEEEFEQDWLLVYDDTEHDGFCYSLMVNGYFYDALTPDYVKEVLAC